MKAEIAPYKYPRAIEYVETLPRRGYRFIPAVEVLAGAATEKAASLASLESPRIAAKPAELSVHHRRRARLWAVGVGALITVLLAVASWLHRATPAVRPPSGRVMLG